MTPTAETWAQVSQLIANFAWGIDRGNPALAAEQFTVNGKLILPETLQPDAAMLTLEGRDRIRARWEGRENVVTRHVFLNLSLVHTSSERIAGTVLSLGFRHDGTGVGEPKPVVVTDFDDIIVRDIDGQWRFAERKVSVVFARAQRE